MNVWSFDGEWELGNPREDGDPGQPGLGAPPLVCATIAELHGTPAQPEVQGQRILDALEARAWFRAAIEDPDVLIVGKSIDSDLVVMCADDPRVTRSVFDALAARRVRDVGLREGLLDIARGKQSSDHHDETGARYSLAQLVAGYLGIDINATKVPGADAWRYKFARLRGIPIPEWPKAATDYLRGDSIYPLQVFALQELAASQMQIQGAPPYWGSNLHLEPDEVFSAFVLRLMTVWGLRTNREKVAALERDAHLKDVTLRDEMRRLDILRPDRALKSGPRKGLIVPGSVDKSRLAEFVTAAYEGLPPQAPKGGVSTDRDTLVESGDPVLKRIGEGGKNNKTLTTYLPILRKGLDVPWLPWYNSLVASQRVSSDAQQFPKKGGIRECFEARPGKVYCSTDHEGGELRTMSQRAIWEPRVGYSRMAEALNKGLDPHALVASQWMSISYEEAIKLKKAKDPKFTPYRDVAKIKNFGAGGGMGPASMVYNARVKEDVRFCVLLGGAKKCGEHGYIEKPIKGQKKRICAQCFEIDKFLLKGWKETWTEQAELFELAGAETATDYATVLMFDGYARGNCGYSQWLNTPFQRLLAIATKRAMIRISTEMHCVPSSPLFGQHLVLQVHDELISELDEDIAPEAGDRQAKIMVEELQKLCPDLAPACACEPALSRFLSKSAATVRDPAGRLMVWEPSKEMKN